MKCTFENKLKRYIGNLLKFLKEENVMICFIEDEMFFLFIDVIILVFIISCSYLDDCDRD